MTPARRPTGMLAFIVVWVGQVVSLLGTGMTRFALTTWAWQVTGSATALALVAFFSLGPAVLLSPVAGALVDRAHRKVVMMLSDLAAGLSTLVILLLYVTGHLRIWHLYTHLERLQSGHLAGEGGPRWARARLRHPPSHRPDLRTGSDADRGAVGRLRF
jgi:Na+/melibiose symporter-like transporter